MTTAHTLAASLVFGVVLPFQLAPSQLAAQGAEPNKQGGSDRKAPQEQGGKADEAGKKKAELPKLPPSKTDALDELLEKYGSSKKPSDPKAEQGKRAGATRDGSTGDARGNRKKSKLDELDEIVRKAREKRLAREQAGLAASIPVNPFIGTWSIASIARGPRRGPGGGSGYVVFTPAFVSMHIFAQGSTGNSEPRWQSSFRRYWVQGGKFVTSSLLGIGNQGDGESIVLEAGGRRETRRFLFLAPNALRIIQGPNQYIDLRLIERF